MRVNAVQGSGADLIQPVLDNQLKAASPLVIPSQVDHSVKAPFSVCSFFTRPCIHAWLSCLIMRGGKTILASLWLSCSKRLHSVKCRVLRAELDEQLAAGHGCGSG